MNRRHLAPALLLAACLALAGCGGGKNEAKPVGSSAGTAKAKSYDGVEDLRDAYIRAGGECNDWNKSNKVTGAAESGECGGSVVLSTYLSSQAAQDQVKTTKEALGDTIALHWLVGENWIINAPDVDDVKKKLGGTIVSSSGSSESPSADKPTSNPASASGVEATFNVVDASGDIAYDFKGKVTEVWAVDGDGDTVDFDFSDPEDARNVSGTHPFVDATMGSEVTARFSGWGSQYGAECELTWEGDIITSDSVAPGDGGSIDCSGTIE
jgi:hypothetical protein